MAGRTLFPVMFALAAIACGDPVHDEAVEALGGETPGVPANGLHRPGQPCVTCHGDSGPASSQFSLAGTIFALPRDPRPAAGASVQIEDITGLIASIGTNAGGNFYVREEDWQPRFPLKVKVTLGPLSKQMTTYIARAASCGDCHTDLPGPSSPGQIYIANNPSDLPSAPPGP